MPDVGLVLPNVATGDSQCVIPANPDSSCSPPTSGSCFNGGYYEKMEICHAFITSVVEDKADCLLDSGQRYGHW